MIPLPSGTKIWLVTGITDIRNGFNGLAAKVRTVLKDDPMSGHVFIFRGRSSIQVKLLWSTGDADRRHLQAQLDKLRRMNFDSRSEKVSRRIAQIEADLNRLQKESDTLTGRVDDPAVQRPLRQTRTLKPFPD